MIWRHSLPFLLAGLLAGCGAGEARGPGVDDWRSLLAKGDGAGAERALRKEIEAGTPARELAPFLGEAELQQGNLVEAERWLATGEFAPSTVAHGYHMLGRLLLRQGNLPAAGNSFDRALASGPDDPELWVDVGRLRWIGGEQVEAIDAAKRAVKAGPDNPIALLFRAQLVRDAQGSAAAIPIFERGLAASPDNADLLAEYAATLGEAGRAVDMLDAVRKLARAAPGDRRSLYLQALLAARARRYDLARSLIERSGTLDREVPAAMLLLALVDMENGNYASAAQGLDQLLRRQPDNVRVEALLARALLLSGNHRELVARFAGRADGPYIAMLVGRAYEALGDRGKAARFVDAALTGGPVKLAPIRPAAVRANLGEGATAVAYTRAALVDGRAGMALARTGEYLTRHSGSVEALELAGDTALAAGDAGRAIQLYTRAASVRRTWPLVVKMTAAFDRLGLSSEATDLVARHLKGEPANADAAVLLARRLLDRGDRPRADALTEYARSRGRNDRALLGLRPG